MATNLREAPPLPEMPEFENVRPMPQQGRGPVAMQDGYGGGGGVTQISMGRQLRRLMGMLAGGGLAPVSYTHLTLPTIFLV